MGIEVAPGTLIAGCRVEAVIGRGAMATVYRARDERLDRTVALKVLSPELGRDERFRDRFLRESRIAAGIEHPTIIPIYASGEIDGALYLVMRFVDGTDLRGLIKAEGRLELDRALGVLAQIAEGLDAAHAQGLVHRDVKPANILVAAGDRASLADFGLAKHAATINSLTRDSAFAGTIDYVAPEQIQGGEVDGRADVYALACTLFECLAGVAPFHRESDLAAVLAHLKEPPPALSQLRPDLPAALDAVIAHGLAKDPDDRHRSCTELIADARAAGAGEPISPATGSAQLRTFLIADVRGYTRYTQQHGDEAGARLAAMFAEMVGKAVSAGGGRLIELRGDEALAAFDSSRLALQAAIDIQARATELELARGVGIGLDAGEAVPVGKGYRGGALNTAARLCALAGPGEVLATDGVTHLAGRVEGLRYLEGRLERLKGIDHPVRVVEIVPRHRGDAIVKRLRRRTQGRRWIPVSAALAIIVAVSAAAGLVFSGGGGRAAIGSKPDTLSAFDASSGRFLGGTRLSGKNVGGGVVWVGGAVWTWVDGEIIKIDPHTKRIVGSVSTCSPDGPVAAAGYVWGICQDSERGLVRIEPNYATPRVFTLPKMGGCCGDQISSVVAGGGAVWVAQGFGRIVKLNPDTGRVSKRIDGFQTKWLAYAGGYLYSGGGDQTVSKFNPSTGARLWHTKPLAGGVDGVVVRDGHLWALVTDTGAVDRLRLADGGLDDTIDTGSDPVGITSAAGSVWVTNARSSTVTRISTATDATTTFDVGHSPQGIAVHDGTIWTTLTPNPADQLVGITGRVLQVGLQRDLGEQAPDPTVNDSWADDRRFWEMEYATEAKLFNYADPDPARGVTGVELVPEIAAAIPDTSGRTVTIRIRPGFRFSPPSGRPVTAETMRRSIERALLNSNDCSRCAQRYLDAIVGEHRFQSGQAADISGLTAAGDVLTFRLTRPVPDLPAILATPFFSAVPDNTPTQPVDDPIPSAGPYYLASLNWSVVLKRNPDYGGSRPQRLDAIVYDTNIDGPPLGRRTLSGSLDYVADPFGGSTNTFPSDPTLLPGAAIAHRFGPGSEAARAGHQRWFNISQTQLWFDALNTQHGVFRDLRIRRAFEMALDRPALARIDASIATDRMIPPSMTPSAPDQVPPPNLRAARVLARPARGREVVLVDCAPYICAPYTAIEERALQAIGLHVVLSHNYQTRRWDVIDQIWDTQPFDPAAMFAEFGGEFGGDGPAPLPWVWQERLDRANRLTVAARDAALLAFDSKLETEYAAAIPFAQPTAPVFFSARVGCIGFSPPYGVDLAALCLPRS